MPDKIAETFALTTKLLFGKPLPALSKHAEWLTSRLPPAETVNSVMGKGSTYLPDYGFFKRIPRERVVSFENLQAAAEKRMAVIGEAETLASIGKEIGSAAYFVPSFAEGRNLNVENTSVYIDCLNVKNSFDPFTTKNSAYNFGTMDSEALFGVYRTINSSFSIHCYQCSFMQRCFEMDCAKSCSDSMFCHNVESLSNCLFCFNVKSKRYAVGNVEIGKEKYLSLKQQLMERILPELEKTGRLPFDIYDILAKRRHAD